MTDTIKIPTIFAPAKKAAGTQDVQLSNISKKLIVDDTPAPKEAVPIIKINMVPITKPHTTAAQVAQRLMNTRPELIIKRIEQEAIKVERIDEEKQAVTNATPMISLSALISAQKEAIADKKQDVLTQDIKDIDPSTMEFALPGEEFYDESQERALEGMLKNQFCCLIGAAGTGKTYTLKKFLQRLKEQSAIELLRWKVRDPETKEERITMKPSIVFCAFTGRAVEQMKRALPIEYHSVCGTIHGDKVLAFVPEFYEEINDQGQLKNKVRFVPSFDETRKLPYKYYVVDETGMFAVDLYNKLRAAMRPDAIMIMVGDINQLPPVYGRSILGFAMTQWPVFELTTIHRQAANNPIIANAHKILNGLPPDAAKDQFDLYDLNKNLKERANGSLAVQQEAVKVIKFLHKSGQFNELQDGFIVPWNKQSLGQITFNELLTPYFNPPLPNGTNKRTLIKTGAGLAQFAVGDKVMLLQNDKQNNLTNGQIGIVVAITINGAYKGGVSNDQHKLLAGVTVGEEDDFAMEMPEEEFEVTGSEEKKDEEINQRQADHIVTVIFETDITKIRETIRTGERDNVTGQGIAEVDYERKSVGREVAFSTAGEFRKLAHAYCITCHKSQGGEYPTVVILCHSANAVSLSREWLYTAVTRARNRIVLIFNERGLFQCLRNQRIKGRNLAEKIKSFVEISEKDAKDVDAIVPNLPQAREL